MSGLLESLFGEDTDTVEQVRAHTGNDRKRAEQAYNAAAGTILRGLEAKSQTQEGAESIWEMLRKQAEQGNIPANAPSQGSRVQVKELDPKTANDMMKAIFGKDARKSRVATARSSHSTRRPRERFLKKYCQAYLAGCSEPPKGIRRTAHRHCRKSSTCA